MAIERIWVWMASFGVLAAGFGGCVSETISVEERERAEPVDARTEPLIGGAITTARPEIGKLHIDRGDGVATCTGTLIAPGYVLTAGHCFDFALGTGVFVLEQPVGDDVERSIEDFRRVGHRPRHTHQVTLDGFSSDLAVVRLLGLVPPSQGTPVPIADALPSSSTTWSTRFGYGATSRGGSDGGVKRFASFQGLTSNVGTPGDSGGPVLFGNGVNASPIWGVISSLKHEEFIFPGWNISTRDWDVNVTYFKSQIQELMAQWDGGFLYGLDLPGGDYRSFATNRIDICKVECANESRCAAFTWFRGTCHLKEVIPNFTPLAGASSGLGPRRSGSGMYSPWHWDRWGGDYSISTVSYHAHCARACAEDERCLAFATSTGPGSALTCYLKDARPAPYRKTNVRSEAKRGLEMDTDRFGSDYHSYDIAEYSPERCQASCARDSRCRAWSFVAPRGGEHGRCHLKDATPSPRPMLGVVSGRSGFEFY